MERLQNDHPGIRTAAAAAGCFYRLSLMWQDDSNDLNLCRCANMGWCCVLVTLATSGMIFSWLNQMPQTVFLKYVSMSKKSRRGKKNRKSKNAQNPHVFIPGWSPPSRPATPQPLPIAQPGTRSWSWVTWDKHCTCDLGSTRREGVYTYILGFSDFTYIIHIKVQKKWTKMILTCNSHPHLHIPFGILLTGAYSCIAGRHTELDGGTGGETPHPSSSKKYCSPSG